MEQARKEELLGRDIVHMEVGQPGTPAPRNAIKELTKKINSEPLGYTVALGIPELRRKISNLYKDLVWFGYKSGSCDCYIWIIWGLYLSIYCSF